VLYFSRIAEAPGDWSYCNLFGPFDRISKLDCGSTLILDDYFRQYALLATFAAFAVAVPTGMLLTSWMLSLLGIRPQKPSLIKQAIYECGFETLSGRWSQFNFRFYSFALIFIVFDVEVVFLFPWAASFGVMSATFGVFVLLEMVVFVGILVVGWLYAWKKGALEWS
jgi:NADH-quinone oxidoreductase subunit A